jgi:transcriptional regulator GlxA family with amidase domain
LDITTLGGSGVDPKALSPETIDRLRTSFLKVHNGNSPGIAMPGLGPELLEALITHLGRIPRPQIGLRDPKGYSLIVARAREYIREHLDEPLTVDRIAVAASTSHRTLHRSFQTVLNETPYSYVLKLRLHRIRHELVTEKELARSIACIANRWGISELGRLAGWYRDLFGEPPSETAARHRNVTPL